MVPELQNITNTLMALAQAEAQNLPRRCLPREPEQTSKAMAEGIFRGRRGFMFARLRQGIEIGNAALSLMVLRRLYDNYNYVSGTGGL